MKQQKQRVEQPNKPAYPQLKEAQVRRRDFLALLGGGAALTLLGACGIPLGGVVAHDPNLFNLRFPEQDNHPTHLGDESYLSYILWSQHENRLFNDYMLQNKDKIFADLDQKLKQYTYDNLATEQAIKDVAWALRTLLEDRFMKDQQQDVAFVALRLEVVRLQRAEQRLGGGAPNPYP